MRDLFASDYGVLDDALLHTEYITNPSELLRSRETYGVLRLCGVNADEGSDAASDFELFLSFCRAFPSLRGHLVAARTETLLRETLSLSLPLTEENAASLWREGTERLASAPLRVRSLLDPEIPWLCERKELMGRVLLGQSFVYDAALLAPQTGESLSARHSRLLAEAARLSAEGCVGVRLCLPADYRFLPPNPYAVESALARARRNSDERALLLSQQVREVSEACVAAGLPLLIECEGDGSVAELLRYVGRTVGLPTLTVAVRSAQARDAMLTLAETQDLRIALRLCDAPTRTEMRQALEAMAARYPIGRVRLITGADLRQSAIARKQAEALIG